MTLVLLDDWRSRPSLVSQGSATHMPYRPGSIDLAILSPPYFGLRLYVDGGVAYRGQLGAEPTPEQFLQALWQVLRELWDALAPWGNAFVNLGDKRTGSGGHNNQNIASRAILRDLPGIGLGYANGEAHSVRGQPRKYAGRDVSRGAIDPTEAQRAGSRQQRMASWIDGRPAAARHAPRLEGRPAPGGMRVNGMLNGRQPAQGGALSDRARSRQSPDRYTQEGFGRPKSKMLLPHRFAIGCEDGLADPCVRDHDHYGFHTPGLEQWEACRGMGWLVRQDQVWQKLNHIPESVPDRTHDGHEYWFHLTKSADAYYGTERIRVVQDSFGERHEGKSGYAAAAEADGGGERVARSYGERSLNPLGKMPDSVRAVGTEPLRVPRYLVEEPANEVTVGLLGLWGSFPRSTRWEFLDAGPLWTYAWHRRFVDEYEGPIMVRELSHYAAFPSEWPRWLIQGWAPLEGVCTACGEPRRRRTGKPCEECDELVPTQAKSCPACGHRRDNWKENRIANQHLVAGDFSTPGNGVPRMPGRFENETQLGAAVCGCPDTSAPVRPARVLDCFGGTGTTAMVARALGAIGVSLDLSWDYSRLSHWRIFASGYGEKVRQRANRAAQGTLMAVDETVVVAAEL